MKHFFITGLPRSRTAWLANFFTTGPVFCHHDLSRTGLGPLFEEREYDYVGDSDSGLLLYTDQLVKRFPTAPWLLLNTSIEAAAKSYLNYFTPDNEYPGVASKDVLPCLQQSRKLYDYAHETIKNQVEITPDKLDDKRICQWVWSFLLPSVPWNEDRYNMLNTFRVNIIPQKLCLL